MLDKGALILTPFTTTGWQITIWRNHLWFLKPPRSINTLDHNTTTAPNWGECLVVRVVSNTLTLLIKLPSSTVSLGGQYSWMRPSLEWTHCTIIPVKNSGRHEQLSWVGPLTTQSCFFIPVGLAVWDSSAPGCHKFWLSQIVFTWLISY